MQQIVERLTAGKPVELRPVGNSMQPMINSRDLVRIVPHQPDLIDIGQVVLVRVRGRVMVHKVSAIEQDRIQISNNHGRVNGWTSRDRVFGIVSHVNGIQASWCPTALAS